MEMEMAAEPTSTLSLPSLNLSTGAASTLAALPAIPAKRYFTIGEVSELCGVKPHVLRYWEQEFTQLKPLKRRGNRRYYQHHEVLLIRRIRELLYEHGFTINGARNRLEEPATAAATIPAAVGARAVSASPGIVAVGSRQKATASLQTYEIRIALQAILTQLQAQ